MSMAASGPAGAQIRGAHAVPQAHPSHGRPTAPPFIPARRNGFRHRGERGVLANGLFYYPDYFGDYYEEPAPSGPPVQEVVVQQPPQPAVAALPPKPIEPLVLEERDGQWTRIPIGSQVPVSAQAGRAEEAEGGSRLEKSSPTNEEAAQAPAKLPPVILVFRDGRQEQIGNYMIQGDVLYTSADYWSTGSWTRKIPITDLDVPASLKLNAERGAKFSLPRGPSQVVVRF
jgi:hypothetical protein